jgi:hypothetical protein
MSSRVSLLYFLNSMEPKFEKIDPYIRQILKSYEFCGRGIWTHKNIFFAIGNTFIRDTKDFHVPIVENLVVI